MSPRLVWLLCALCLIPLVALASGRFQVGVMSPATTDSTPCGETDPCAADSYEATTTSGPGFTCNSQLSNCVDLGPGTNNEIGTNVSGHVVIGSGGGGVFKVGDNFTAAGNGSLSVGNGAINANGSTILRNETGGTALTIDETDGTRMVPQASTPSCAAGNAGTWSTLTGDGRARYCDGSSAKLVSLVLSGSASLDFANLTPHEKSTALTVTVTGAATTDRDVHCSTGASLGDNLQVYESWVSASDTVSVRLHNTDTANSEDLAATMFYCFVHR